MSKNNEVISLKNVCKSYKVENEKLEILSNINVKFYSGKLYAIMGESGSGKSTLINILGLVDNFDTGDYIIYDKNLKTISEEEICKIRMKNIGFIFQNIYLDTNLKAYENVMLPMLINKSIKNKKEKSLELLKSVKLEDRVNHFPQQLSGGEEQRVAIARALANDPTIILADEPTGNLDKKNEKIIFEKLKEISKSGKCVIVVSHSENIKKYADEIYYIENRSIKRGNL